MYLKPPFGIEKEEIMEDIKSMRIESLIRNHHCDLENKNINSLTV